MTVHAASPFKRIPVTVLTGFLGSGKTTLLNYLVRQPGMDRALVIINEFGSVGLDHDLMERSSDDLVVEMMGGCLCCTISGDLLNTLRDAPSRFSADGQPAFDRVVIETTGLADPAPILHTLLTDSWLYYRYELRGVVTTVDAATGLATLSAHEEAAKQVAVADRLLLTKTDLAANDDVQELRARLAALNPAAPVTQVDHGRIDPAVLFDLGLYDPATKSSEVVRWLAADAYPQLNVSGHQQDHGHSHDHRHAHDHGHSDVNRHDSRIRAICLTFDEPLVDLAFDRWIGVLTNFAGERLLRMKAIVNIEGVGRPMVLHAVQHIMHMPVELDDWPSDDHRTRMVLIVRDMDEEELRGTLALLTEGVSKYRFEGWPFAESERAHDQQQGVPS